MVVIKEVDIINEEFDGDCNVFIQNTDNKQCNWAENGAYISSCDEVLTFSGSLSAIVGI